MECVKENGVSLYINRAISDVIEKTGAVPESTEISISQQRTTKAFGCTGYGYYD